MGLLDNILTGMQSPGGRLGLGLLAAAGPTAQPRSFGQRAMGLLAQMDADKAAEEERKQRAQMQALQEQLLKAQLGERADMAADRQAQRAAQQAQQQRLAEFNARLRPNASAALAGGGGPTVENAAKLGQGPDLRALAMEFPELIGKIKEIDSVRNLGLDEVARTIEARGPDGMPVTEQRDKFGRLVGTAIPKAVEMQIKQFGGRSQAVNPFALPAGQVFEHTVTPDALLSAETARRGQNMADARQREANDLNRQAQRTQLIETPQGWMRVDKGTGVGERVTAPDGKPVPSDSAMKREGGARRVLMLLDDAEKLVSKATGSFIGAGIDLGGRAIGLATPGAEAIGQLKALEGSLLAEMPRMEGPQSNADVKMYQQAAGALGDPTTPRAVKMAAIETIRTLQSRYAGIEPPASGPQRITSDAEYNALPSGAVFIDPDGKTRRKP